MKTAICYFTGTGNSLDISDKLAQLLDAQVFSIPKTTTDMLQGYERLVVVTPIYSFGIAQPTRMFIEGLKGCSEIKECYGIIHYAGFPANSAQNMHKVFIDSSLPINNVYKMQMPLNFTLFFTPTDGFINGSLKKTQKAVNRIADEIKSSTIKNIKPNMFAFLDEVNQSNIPKLSGLAKEFIITDDCVSCGKCTNICPVGNITKAEDEKPSFGDSCVACLGCFHRCPKGAINYGNRTIGKKRYCNPNIKLD